MEYQYIPSFTITEDLLDLTPYLPDDFLGEYPEWVGKQINLDGAIYGVPWDTGPLGFIYRKDLLDKAGITEPPKTWDEFADAARKYHEANPESYLANMPGNRRGAVVRPVLAERRPALRRHRGEPDHQPHRPEDPGGHRVLGRADPGRRHLHRRGLHQRLVPGPRQRQVRGLGLRRVGAGLPPGHGGQDLGQVARGQAAAVERGRRRVRQLGRLHARGAQEHEVPRARGRALALAAAGAGADEDVHARAVPVPAEQRRCSRTRSG